MLQRLEDDERGIQKQKDVLHRSNRELRRRIEELGGVPTDLDLGFHTYRSRVQRSISECSVGTLSTTSSASSIHSSGSSESGELGIGGEGRYVWVLYLSFQVTQKYMP